MIVNHWSKQADLTATLPEFAGTGVRGAERDRAQVKGTYFGLPGYREPAVQANRTRYTAELDSETLYNLDSDPLGLILTAQSTARQTENNARYEFEKLVLDSGFVGYYAQNVVKVFVPVQVQKVG
jgi:hypothetical protein